MPRWAAPTSPSTRMPCPTIPQSPFVTSGMRIGTPAITTRGFKERESRELTGWMCDILDDLANETVIDRVRVARWPNCALGFRCTADFRLRTREAATMHCPFCGAPDTRVDRLALVGGG
jgi:hypothetical protein